MSNSSQYSPDRIPERTIKITRCRHCGRQTYLQYIPIPNTDIDWILFDHPGGKLHRCVIKPLIPGKEKLIHDHIEQMMKNNTNSSSNHNNIIVERLDTIIEMLNGLKENIINSDYNSN